jgi:hypothetical protein
MVWIWLTENKVQKLAVVSRPNGIYGFHKTLGSFWQVERLSASQEGLCRMHDVSLLCA